MVPLSRAQVCSLKRRRHVHVEVGKPFTFWHVHPLTFICTSTATQTSNRGSESTVVLNEAKSGSPLGLRNGTWTHELFPRKQLTLKQRHARPSNEINLPPANVSFAFV